MEPENRQRAQGGWAAVQALISGVTGDVLEAAPGPWAPRMTVRVGGLELTRDSGSRRIDLPDASPDLCVLVHGLGATEGIWAFDDGGRSDYASRLAGDLGYTPVHVRYNTGRRIEDNGHDLAYLLGTLVAAWPVPVRSLLLIGHSMGGLVIRAALQAGDPAPALLGKVGRCARRISRRSWILRVDRLVLLGTPNRGAWMPQLSGSLADRITALGLGERAGALLVGPSPGIRDLRHGLRRDARHRSGHHPRRVRVLLVAGALGDDGSRLSRWLGDGMVAPASAFGMDPDGAEMILPGADLCLLPGVGHRSLAHSPEVYSTIREWMHAG